MDQEEHQVTPLLAPDIPADRGLSGLGLIMQLGGSLMLAFGALIVLMPLMMPASPGMPRMTIFLIGVLSGIRSLLQRSAGAGLLYGSAKGHLYALKRYIIVGLVQSIVIFLLLKKMSMPTDASISLLVLLCAWPLALGGMMMLPQFKTITHDLPHPEDMGFESAAVLMAIMGVAGSLVMALVVYAMVGSSAMRAEVPGIMLILVSGMLLVRSVMHAKAGLQGVSGASTDKATQSANLYVQFGITSAIITGAVFLLQMLMQSQRMGIEILIPVVLLSYVLIIWPTVLRSFFTERNFSLILDDEKTTRRAPDTGLTAVGWLLFTFGALAFANGIGGLFVEDTGQAMQVTPLLAELSQLSGSSSQSPLWGLALGSFELFAGFSLITMLKNYKQIVTAYGVVASFATLYLSWPMLKLFKESADSPMAMPFVYGSLIIGLSVSVGAVLLVNRQESSDAKARIVA